MKSKKNPITDLNRNRGPFFPMGLTFVMAVGYAALEWQSHDTINTYNSAFDVDPLLDEEVRVINIKLPPPPKLPMMPYVI